MYRTWGIPTIFIFAAGAAVVFAQDGSPQPTARELFYQAAPTQHKSTPAKSASVPKRTPPANPTVAVTPPPSGGPPATSANNTPPAGASGGSPVHIIKASEQSGPPLGLRYSIVRLVDGKMVEVPQNFVFHAHDHIQVRVQTNAPGYLYVVNQGSSGAWEPMFPSPKIDQGDNRVDGWHTYTLPTPDYQMSFDELAGTENLTIVFSRQPVPDFEDLIYSLQGHSAKPASEAQPAGEMAAPRPNKGMVMMASVRIDDNVVNRLRNASSRDLIVEPVDSNTPADSSGGDKKETAVYVVNPAGSPDSRLVADLHLVHR